MQCFGDFTNEIDDNFGAFGVTTLRRGSRGADVMELQKVLNRLGYNAGVEDGIFGAGTESAVKSFQAANGLGADGVVGPMTYSALKSKGVTVSKAPATTTTSSSSSSSYSSSSPVMAKTGFMDKLARNKGPIIGGIVGLLSVIAIVIIAKNRRAVPRRVAANPRVKVGKIKKRRK